MGSSCPAWLRSKIFSFHCHLDSSQGRRKGLFREFAQTVLGENKIPDPFSLEIHPHLPGTSRCTGACKTCTGQSYDQEELFAQGLPEELLARLIHDITHDEKGEMKARIPAVSFAGNCVEPLIYPDLHRHMGQAMKAAYFVGILTNMVLGDEATFDVFTDPALKARRFFRASLNAATPSDYNDFHRPGVRNIKRILSSRGIPLGPGETVFDRVIKNMERIALLRKQRKMRSRTALQVNYLLYPGNDKEREIAELVKWADRIGLDAVNFRMPQMPQMCTTPFVPLEAQRVRELKNYIGMLLSSTRMSKEVPLTAPLEETRPKPFNNCWTRFVFAVVGFDGGLYPCTSVAAPQCSDFGEGNLNAGPNFWDLWNDPRRIDAFTSFFPNKCDKPLPVTSNPSHVCTRTEFAFNLLLDRYWTPTEDKVRALCRLFHQK